MQKVRIYHMPDCRMVSSGVGQFDDPNFALFDEWAHAQPLSVYPQDFLFYEGEWGKTGGFHWLCLYDGHAEVPEGLSVIDFKGGYWAVVTDIDAQPNESAMRARDEFLREHGLEIDTSRPEMGHVVCGHQVKELLGYAQMDYWTPVKKKT